VATINGTAGNDTLTGTSGNDTINGLGGNDLIRAGSTGGTDVVDGGAGFDSIEFASRATSALIVDFVAGTISGGSSGTISFTSVERIVASNFNDRLSGNGSGQTLAGQAGADTLRGAGGVDTLWGGGGADIFIFREIGTGNADSVRDFGSGTDKLLLGGSAMSALGAAGDFAAGDARFKANSTGTATDASDRVLYNTTTRQIFYDADGNGSGVKVLIATLQSGATLAATDIVVEGGGGGGVHLVGTGFEDNLVGGAGDDTLEGLAGDDTLDGSDGNDRLLGGDGADLLLFQAGSGNYGSDTLDGGAGDDFISFGVYATSGVVIDLRAGTLSGGRSSGSATFTNIENAIGGAFNDLLVAYDGVDLGGGVVIGSQLEGRDGNDTVLGGLAGDNLFGGSDDDEIRGGAGDDYINAGTGRDSLFGDAGDDFFELSVFGADSGEDTVDGGTGTDYMSYTGARSALVVDFVAGTISGGHLGGGGSKVFANIENFISGDGADRITGDDAANVLQGGFGSDTIDGAAGNDTIYGGTEGNPFDQPDELSGGAGNDVLTGSSAPDAFIFDVTPGAANADVITNFVGQSDKMPLDGTAHANSGPSGNFSAGDVRFWSSASGTAHDADDRVIYNTTNGQLWYDADGNGAGAAQLIATLQGAPTLVATDISIIDGSGGGGGSTISGTAGNDTLTGTGGDDTIDGLGGNDRVLAGSTGGADVVNGGAGFDSIEFASRATSAVVVDFAAGTISGGSSGSISFSGVERVVASNFNDSLTGSAGVQTLAGQAGADTLWGAGGVDTLWGGGGGDTFIFREMGPANADSVRDWASGSDEAALDDAAFTAIGAAGDFAAGDPRFKANATGTATDTSDRVVYNTSSGSLYYDADGSGGGAAQLIATFQGAPAVSVTDITVI
jgi:Ca2+-binding RTX toxin-like protein